MVYVCCSTQTSSPTLTTKFITNNTYTVSQTKAMKKPDKNRASAACTEQHIDYITMMRKKNHIKYNELELMLYKMTE
jgi:hypothetical protein